MDKILLIINREYITRVRKKSFIIMTLLSPLLFAGLISFVTYLNTQEDTDNKVIAIEDLTGLYNDAFESTDYIRYEFLSDTDSTQKQQVLKDGYHAIIVISDDLLNNKSAIQVYSESQITINVTNNIKHQINNYLKDQKLASYQIDDLSEKINEINNTRVDLQTIRLNEEGEEKESSAAVAIIIGIAAAMLLYMFLLLYGTQVMRGVIEEKTNRIVEVMISTVKPFQLMMGKIIGIGLVAITQFGLWIILSLFAVFILQSFIFPSPEKVSQGIEITQSMQSTSGSPETAEQFNNVLQLINDSNIFAIIGLFIFYFIGGYLVYSTLFVAIGSAVDNETDTQQFVTPIILPLIFSIYVAMAAFNNPHGDIAFWFSIIPFTSPVVMMSRIPFDVPTWEIILSMAILTISFIVLTWFAGKVYRTGILMYGKKASYKEIWKWFKQSGK